MGVKWDLGENDIRKIRDGENYFRNFYPNFSRLEVYPNKVVVRMTDGGDVTVSSEGALEFIENRRMRNYNGE